MARIIKIELNAQLQWQIGRSASDHWIGVCRPLGLTMEGDSLDDLFQNINQSIQLLMVDLLETGELDEFLRSRGWRALPANPHQQGPVEFDVPYNLLVNTARDSARSLLQ
jgi:predicted RNase H-like HicB family nuclease